MLAKRKIERCRREGVINISFFFRGNRCLFLKGGYFFLERIVLFLCVVGLTFFFLEIRVCKIIFYGKN